MRLKKITTVLMAAAMCISGLTAVPADANAAASSSAASSTTRISVHDPSIFYDSSTGSYNIYGSHMAQASSKDLRNWSAMGTQGYTNKSLYASENVEGIY